MFLMQFQIIRFRSNLQELLDSMMPSSLVPRVQAGETVIEACDDAAVLFCAFPVSPPPQLDVVKAFLLLDRVHQAFDDLLAASGRRVRTIVVTDPNRIAVLPTLKVVDTVTATVSQALAVSMTPAPKSWF